MVSVKFYVHLYVIIYFTHLLFGQDAELNILVCDWNPPGIFDLAVHAGKIRKLPIANVARPVAIDYDPQTQMIYWTDVLLKQIRATHILGTTDTVLLNLTENAVPEGLAIDTIHRRLFFIDAGNDIIVSMHLNGSDVTTILDEGHDEPRAIDLHEENRIIYWTDWGSNAYISKANYDGTNRETLVDSGLIWPNGLTLDKTRNILYWCDAKTHKIESFNIDTSQRTEMITEPSAHYFGIFFHQDTLYYTDWLREAVMNIAADGGPVTHIGRITSSNFGQLAGVYVFSNMNNTNCSAGQYGSSCEDCGQCMTDTTCDKVTGICLHGCKPGFVGVQCKTVECPGNTYGDTCMPCGRCAGGVACDTQTGQCTGGCESGWTGDKCDSAQCPGNTYGDTCMPCGRCAGGVACDTQTGQCTGGCATGWTGDKCDRVACPPNTYGTSCLPCGRCAEGRPCASVTGFCSAGCMEGWTGARCDTACPLSTYGELCTTCGHCKHRAACDPKTGLCPDGCDLGWTGSQCIIQRDEDEESSGSQGSSFGLIVGVGVAGAVLVVIIIVIIILVMLRRKKKRESERRSQMTYETLDTPHVYCVPRDLPPHYSTVGDIPPPTDDGYSSVGSVAHYSLATGTVSLGHHDNQRQTVASGVYGVPDFPEKAPRESLS